jgi:hypothetical protein
MNNRLEVLGINLIKADEEYKSATERLLDASDKMREAMQKEGQYWVVVNDRLLRWRDGLVQIE